MHYGLELPNGGACGDPRTLAEFADLAEQSGWDGIFLEDYIVYYTSDTLTYDPWVALAAMALRTHHIRLGTTVTALARRRPWKLARELTTLDHLSNGRMILSVGLGDPLDFNRFGEPDDATRRAELLDEGLDILAGLWSGSPFSFSGHHYTLADVTFVPTPVQTPRIPIWIGGSSQRQGPVRRAAHWDGMIPVPISTGQDGRHLTPDEVRDLRTSIARRRTTPDPFDIALGGLERGADWEQERAHIAAVAEAGATWWMEAVPAADLGTMQAAITRGPLRIGEYSQLA